MKNLICVHRPCPLCKNQTAELLHSIDYAASQNVLPRHYDIVCCDSCSLIYNDYAEPDGVFSQHYAESQKYSSPVLFGGGLSSEEKLKWDHYYQLIAAYLRPDMKILEVGCGKGGFLETLQNHGIADLAGLEQSVECIQILRRKKFQAYENWQQLENMKFDMIIFHAVFEHLPDPRQMMQDIAAHSADNTLLFITVPDADSYCKYDSAPFYYFDREHINHFTRSSLQLLCYLHSFSPLSVQIVQHKSIGPMKFHYDIAGIFQLKKSEMTSAVRNYITSCGQKKIHLPAEIFSSEHVFLWGIGAFVENLLYAGYFNHAKDLHLLDIDKSKQGQLIFGRKIEAPDTLLKYNDGSSAVVITSVLYQKKIIETLQEMGFKGKFYTVDQE